MTIDAITQFKRAIEAAGLAPPDVIHGDGELHRFGSNGKRGDDAAWYIIHTNGIAAGAFGDWRTGLSETWRADIGRPLTPAEREKQRAHIEAAKRKREAAELKDHANAVTTAIALWKAGKPAGADHSYLVCKGIVPHGTRVYRGDLVISGMPCDGAIMIRMRDLAGETHSLQFINADGEKRFLPGGRKRGLYFGIPGERERGVLLVEGFATGASVFEATGQSTLVAFDAGNLEAVAVALREGRPDLRITVCADDDVGTPGNPGLAKATAAAIAVGGLVAVPDFGTNRPDGVSDFNDSHRLRGLDAVKAAVLNAKAPEATQHQKPAPNSTGEHLEARSTIELVRADSIKPEPITWLWNGYFAAGKLHIVAGAPGTGKTTIALALAATLSMAGRWPDGTLAPRGDVLIWSGEDAAADTLIPRLIAMGANLSRVHIVCGVNDVDGRRPFDPAKDFPELALAASRLPDLKCMIVDPIVSAVAGDSHKNSETRRALQPLVDFAEAVGCAIIGITHFSKGSQGRDVTERVTGSLAFGAVARVVMATARLREDEGGGRALVRAKSNIGPDGGGFKYELRQDELPNEPGIVASRVEWCQALEGTAQEILAAAEQETAPGERSAIDEAVDFLRAELAGGPQPAKELHRLADQAGHTDATLRRAKVKLGIRPKKDGEHGTWRWELPPKSLNKAQGAQGAQDAQDAHGFGVEHLERTAEHVPTQVAQREQQNGEDVQPQKREHLEHLEHLVVVTTAKAEDF